MHRIDHPTAIDTLPAPAAAGTPGFFTDGNPSTGTAATVVDKDWMNSVQEEIANVIDAAGVPLVKTDRTQLLAAITALVNGGVTSSAKPRGHLAGLGLANASDADHDITVAVGSARGANDNYDMVLAAALTKQIDAAFSAGDDAGGLFDGSVTTDTWYHVFLIRKDSDGSIDAGFDTDIDAANIPSGYTGYRRIGSVLTDGSSNILPFSQLGDEFLWLAPPLDVNTTVGATSANFVLSVPAGLKVRAVIHPRTKTENSAIYIRSPDQTDQAVTGGGGGVAMGTVPYTLNYIATGGASPSQSHSMTLRTDTSSQIAARADSSSRTLDIMTIGWIDSRGKDD